LSSAPITSVTLDGPTDLAGFRAAVRALVAAGTPPHAVRFVVPAAEPASLFDETVPLPRAALALCRHWPCPPALPHSAKRW
jgi:hypothetical protein